MNTGLFGYPNLQRGQLRGIQVPLNLPATTASTPTALNSLGVNPANVQLTKMLMATSGGVSFSDQTATWIANSGVTVNMSALNNALYWGYTLPYYNLAWNDSPGATWVNTLTWEYWSATTAAWATVPNATAQIFSTSGDQHFGFAPPNDWVPTAVSGTTAYWVRVRCSAFTSQTSAPVIIANTTAALTTPITPVTTGGGGYGAPVTGMLTAVNAGKNIAAASHMILNTTTGTYYTVTFSGSNHSVSMALNVSRGDEILVFSPQQSGTIFQLSFTPI